MSKGTSAIRMRTKVVAHIRSVRGPKTCVLAIPIPIVGTSDKDRIIMRLSNLRYHSNLRRGASIVNICGATTASKIDLMTGSNIHIKTICALSKHYIIPTKRQVTAGRPIEKVCVISKGAILFGWKSDFCRGSTIRTYLINFSRS